MTAFCKPRPTHYQRTPNGIWHEWDDPSLDRQGEICYAIRFDNNSIFDLQTGTWTEYKSLEQVNQDAFTAALLDELTRRNCIQSAAHRNAVISCTADSLTRVLRSVFETWKVEPK